MMPSTPQTYPELTNLLLALSKGSAISNQSQVKKDFQGWLGKNKEIMEKEKSSSPQKNSFFFTKIYHVLALAARAGERELCQQLIDLGCDVNGSKEHRTLHFVVASGSPELLRAWLQAHPGCNLNAENKTGHTALWFAIQKKPSALANILLEKGANPNAGRETALACADRLKKHQLVKQMNQPKAEEVVQGSLQEADEVVLGGERGEEIKEFMRLEKEVEAAAAAEEARAAAEQERRAAEAARADDPASVKTSWLRRKWQAFVAWVKRKWQGTGRSGHVLPAKDLGKETVAPGYDGTAEQGLGATKNQKGPLSALKKGNLQADGVTCRKSGSRKPGRPR